jgi:class 3 adenylate cyclase
MEALRGLVAPLVLALIGVWLAARGRPVLAGVALVAAIAAASVLALPVRRRQVPHAAIVFADIVDSTSLISSLGDSAWSAKLGRYEAATRAAAGAARAAVTKSTGDGFLLVFLGPTATRTALDCAQQLCSAARSEGLDTRSAVHTGPCLVSRGDATGLAVHVAARAMSTAGADGLVVTGAARDALGEQSDVCLEDVGMHKLRGVPEPQRLFRLRS